MQVRQSNQLCCPILVLFIVLLAGCASMAIDWKVAKETNTIDSYAQFEAQYPKSEFAPEAGWEIAKRKNTIDSYGSFMARYPKSNIYKEARNRLVEQLDNLDDNWAMLREGMSINKVDELIGPIDEKIKKQENDIALLGMLVPTNSNNTYPLSLYTLTFVNGKLKKWSKTEKLIHLENFFYLYR